jgi:deazaflavin-dependent oxidoreductase (nitroreductase family)
MPSDLIFKTLNTVHKAVLKASGGRVGGNLLHMPVLELTTIGRKSGQPRTVMLTSPLQEGQTYVIVASRGGDPQHPAWFVNLRDNPDVEVALAGQPKRRFRARVAEGEERTRLWGRVIAAHDNYAGYQTKTDREIPIVLLDPAV